MIICYCLGDFIRRLWSRSKASEKIENWSWVCYIHLRNISASTCMVTEQPPRKLASVRRNAKLEQCFALVFRRVPLLGVGLSFCFPCSLINAYIFAYMGQSMLAYIDFFLIIPMLLEFLFNFFAHFCSTTSLKGFCLYSALSLTHRREFASVTLRCA